MNAIGHTHARLKRGRMGTNDILESGFLPKTRTVPSGQVMEWPPSCVTANNIGVSPSPPNSCAMSNAFPAGVMGSFAAETFCVWTEFTV
jgi:hypothetical protein